MLRKLKKPGRLHLVVYLMIAMAVLLPLVVEADTSYLCVYDHTGVILWGYPYFERWQDTRAQELTDHTALKTGLQMSGYELDWYAANRPEYLTTLYNRINTQFSGRYGVANASYSDSFGEIVMSEANAKNFYYGKEAFKKHLGYDVKVYMTQEPTMFAQLPQVLLGTESDYILHRTHLISFGKSASMSTPNYSTVWLEGPDGDGVAGGSDAIKAVPEYNGADVSPSNTYFDESHYILGARYKNGTTNLTSVKNYHTKYYNASTNAYVLSSSPEDASYSPNDKLAHDTAGDSWTWYFMTGENFATMFPAPTVLWSPSATSYKSYVNWGRFGYEAVIKPRQAEINALIAERIAAINKVIGGTNDYQTDLDAAWKNLFAAQHHDILVTNNFMDGPDNDAYGGGYTRPRCTASMNASNAAISGAMTSIASLVNSSIGYKILVVANPAAYDRTELVDVVLGSGFATPFAIFDGANEIAYEQIDAVNHEVVFFVDLPSLGYKTITIKNQSPTVTPTGMTVDTNQRTVSTNYYDITFGSTGGITKLYDKTISQDILKLNGTISGRFRGKIGGSWLISSGTISFPTVGKLMTVVKETGTVGTGGIPYTSYITIYNLSRRIDFKTTFTFNNQEISATTEAANKGERNYWDDAKLGVLFEAAYTSPTLTADHPFMVTAGQNVQPPQATQHSTGPISAFVGLTWADVTAPSGTVRGFAVFNKGTPAYRSPYTDLSTSTQYTDRVFMPLAWAGWMNDSVTSYIAGDYTYEYALYGHTGDWKSGAVQKGVDEYYFRARTKLDNPHTGSASATKSLFKPSVSNVIVSGVYTRAGALYVRIWENETSSASVNLQSPDYTWYAYNTNMLHNNPTSVSQPISMTHNKIRTLFLTTDANASTNVPAQVTGVTVSQDSWTPWSKLNLSWTANGNTDLRHYNVHRSTTSGFTPSGANKVAEVDTNSYADGGRSAGTTYYYKIQAEDLFGNNGAYSAQASGTTAAAPPTATYNCASTTVTTGYIVSGNHTNLHANDGSYFQLSGAGVLIKRIDWYATATISQARSAVRKLRIKYDGKHDVSLDQNLYLWNYTTSQWDLIDYRTVGTSDQTITWTTEVSATLEKYISATGEIKLRYYGQRTGSTFNCYADWVEYYIEYAP